MTVRNAADLVRVNLLHHLALGLERILLLDNGSRDGTLETVERLARSRPIEVRRDAGPFRQDELMNGLAAAALDGGADWVLPIDADEFFVSSRPLPELLGASAAGALEVELVNFVQRRWRTRAGERGLLTMDHRPSRTISHEDARYHVGAGEWSLVEIAWRPKLIVRAAPGMRIGIGAHDVESPAGPVERASEVVCLHAPLRAKSALEERVEQARRFEEAGMPDDASWQNRDLARDGLDPDWVWRANSNRRGWLDVGGERRALVADRRVRDVVAPHLESPLAAARSRLSRGLR